MTQNSEVEITQRRKLAEMDLNTIPHGAKIPNDIFLKYLTNESPYKSVLMEFGGADGQRAQQIKKLLPFPVHIFLIDINPTAVIKARKSGLMAETGDVRLAYTDEWKNSSYLWLECYGGVYMEGLLCNQINGDWQRVLEVANIHLVPGGFVFIADIFRSDNENPQLITELGKDVETYRTKWQQRYQENFVAGKRLFDLHLIDSEISYGDFLVAKPDATAEEVALEWGNAESLIKLFRSPVFERWATHLDIHDLIQYADQLGLHVVEKRNCIFYSRNKTGRSAEPLNGQILVLQKKNTFQVHPLFKGMTLDEYEVRIPEFDRKIYQPDYYTWYIGQLKKNIPNWQQLWPFIK